MVANDNEPWMRVSKTLCGSVSRTDAIPMATSDCLVLQIATMLSLPLHHVHRVLCSAVLWYFRRWNLHHNSSNARLGGTPWGHPALNMSLIAWDRRGRDDDVR